MKGGKINQIESTYKDVYKNKPFIRIKDGLPQLNEVGNKLHDIGFVYNETTGVLTISSVIDNLIKGAAGQAIQNMNLMFNYDETDGLILAPLYISNIGLIMNIIKGNIASPLGFSADGLHAGFKKKN